MSDGIAITAGSGTTVAADDCASVYYQMVKLADGTSAATAAIAADIGVKANALRVAPASDITAGTYIGEVSEKYKSTAWSACEDETDAATDDEIKAAPGAGVSLVVTDLIITNDATAAITFKLLEDTASAKTSLLGTMKIAASSAFVLALKTPLVLTANKNLGYTTTGTSNYSVFVAGYTVA